MRKLLISILIILLLFLTGYTIVKGLSIGNIKILGFNNIKQESEKIDTQIAEITKMKEQEYKKILSDIESNAKTLLKEKESYATLVSTSTDSEIEKATHTQKYDQDFLWAKIGNHATAEGLELKFDIAVSSVNKENYDLYFTARGRYTNITEFVRTIENDNLLGFKIENFKIVPFNIEELKIEEEGIVSNSIDTSNIDLAILKATFKVSDIAINIDKNKVNSSSNTKPKDENKVEGQTNVNTTENTNKNTTNTNTNTAD